ncbi:ZYBA0S11-02740g1_1 [Zygosaccharomyces bailii CLIB 213]|uniref:ZYBA0S11-02740g1_1 n=1 Tax=Zygosaccharomyces bailii (strain CLIB 213 / ATCC 58445 / CBS 680 / BCRC 21525 / NBRC 1098 / NCYC 1416 / NRRL Y-2227) TaxID=1333698 RepID=A0A8J2TCN6_ZYGB2|nr:ZYBA0S11-02740g1_1 [Zygosaccharomyces bailii CLIB 213]
MDKAHRLSHDASVTFEVQRAEIQDPSPVESLSMTSLKRNTGLFYLLAAQLFNSLMTVSTKALETTPQEDAVTGLPRKPIRPLQVLLARMFITYVGALIYMLIKRRSIPNAPFGPPELRLWLLLRGIVGFCGVFGMYFSLMYLTVSDAVLITFLTPTVTVIAVSIVLKERFTKAEAFGTLASFLGVVLIVRPKFIFGEESEPTNSGAESENPRKRLLATLVGLVGVMGVSGVYIVLKYIGHRAHAIISVAYYSLTVTIVSVIGIAVIPAMQFSWPQGSRQWLLLISLGFFGFVYQLLLTIGIQMERAGRSSAIAYTQLVYAVVWDVLLWHHWPSIWSWLGMVVIVGSTVIVARCKSKDPQAAQPSLNESVELENYE